VNITLDHGKDMMSNPGPQDYYTVHKTQHLALTTIIICSGRFLAAKFCCCRAL